ncbi:hypothetical protein NQZ68_035412 [Dissostichus eleginoides]|nr:hypothetical protein NQZ68_035412 [Dissostichus eleginoides]
MELNIRKETREHEERNQGARGRKPGSTRKETREKEEGNQGERGRKPGRRRKETREQEEGNQGAGGRCHVMRKNLMTSRGQTETPAGEKGNNTFLTGEFLKDFVSLLHQREVQRAASD